MAAEKRGIYFGRMLNLLVSTFRPRTERDFPSNNPQPIEITAFLRRIYFGRACHKITAFQPESGDFYSLLQLFWTSPFSGHLGDPNRDPDGAKNRPGGGIFASGLSLFWERFFDVYSAAVRTFSMAFAASFWTAVVTWA